MVVNILLRVINLSLIKSIGFDNESSQVMTIMSSIFYSQFLNTGILIMITNANF